MSKAEILQAIRSCARKLKHNPTRRELRLTARVSEEALHKHFGGLKGALEKAGLRPSGSGFRQQESTVLLDWARVARKLGKIPTVTEYESRGGFSDMPFHSRYGSWTKVPGAFQQFARKQKIVSQKTSSEGTEFSYKEFDAYFIYYNGKIDKVSSEKSLLNVFKKRKNELRKFINTNKLRFKKDFEEAIIKTAQYFDEIEN